MARTYSGWEVGTRETLGIKTFVVPGNESVRLPLHPAFGPIGVYIAGRVDREVAEIEVTAGHREPDDWGYAYRAVRDADASRWSNHAGGVAEDLNATSWPRGVRNMTAAQVVACRKIRDDINRAAGKRIIDWGGDYKVSPVDQMHWEAADGSTAADFARALKVLTTPLKPKVAAYYRGKPGTRTVRVGSRGDDVKYLKRWFGVKESNGFYGLKLSLKVMAWKRTHKQAPSPTVGPWAWAKILGGK